MGRHAVGKGLRVWRIHKVLQPFTFPRLQGGAFSEPLRALNQKSLIYHHINFPILFVTIYKQQTIRYFIRY